MFIMILKIPLKELDMSFWSLIQPYFFAFLYSFWSTLVAISPYLMIGFFTAGILYAFVPAKQIEKHLGKRGLKGIIKAACLGVPLPLCSCGVIPVAMSLRKNGASQGATTSFLISTPQTGVDSILVTGSILGIFMAIVRPLLAFISGILGGIAVDLLQPKEQEKVIISSIQETKKTLKERCISVWTYGFFTLAQDIAKPLLLGLFISALISIVIPNNFFEHTLLQGFWGMLAMILFAIPLYVCATGSVPIAAALMMKGVSPGMALIFLMTGPATNAATIATVWKVQGKRVAIIYLCAVILTALGSGFLVNQFYYTVPESLQYHAHNMTGLWNQIITVILLLILAYGFIRNHYLKGNVMLNSCTTEDKILTFSVQGMHCSHCASSVHNAIASLKNVEEVQVNLAKSSVEVKGHNLSNTDIQNAVQALGFSCSLKEGDEK